jgi:hypothetical protein
MRDALRRWWLWETRYFRRDGTTRPGERAGLAIGGLIVLVGVVATVVGVTVR